MNNLIKLLLVLLIVPILLVLFVLLIPFIILLLILLPFLTKRIWFKRFGSSSYRETVYQNEESAYRETVYQREDTESGNNGDVIDVEATEISSRPALTENVSVEEENKST